MRLYSDATDIAQRIENAHSYGYKQGSNDRHMCAYNYQTSAEWAAWLAGWRAGWAEFQLEWQTKMLGEQPKKKSVVPVSICRALDQESLTA